MSSEASRVWFGGLLWGLLSLGAGCAGDPVQGPRDPERTPSGTVGQPSAPGGTGGAELGGGAGTSGSDAGQGARAGSPEIRGASGTGGTSGTKSAAPSATGRSGSGGAPGAAGDSGADRAGSGATAGSPAQTGELFSEDFEDGELTKPSWIDAEPELNGAWSVLDAENGKVLAQTASVDDWIIAVAGDYRWTDQTVEARVKLTSEPGKAGIFARVRDLENCYFLYLDGGSNIVLRKRVDNSSDDIQKVKVETQAGTWYTLKLSVVGDRLEGYLDGQLLVSGSDSGVRAGGIGVGTSDCTAQFDDIDVRNQAP